MVQELKRAKAGKIILGLTGGFGSGKSTVANFFQELGGFVVNADTLAHEALLPESPVLSTVEKIFEKDDVTTGDKLDRKKIASIIFQDVKKRRALEAVIHPFVFQRIAEEITAAETPVVVVEVPLLFESGFERFCDHVIFVDAPQELIKQRLAAQSFAPAEIEARQNAQMSMQEKAARSDLIIDNSGDFQKTRRCVEAVWSRFRTASKGAN